jgi:hypothetical protein
VPGAFINHQDNSMPTYKQIAAYVKNKYGYTIKTCWIADVKRKLGYPVGHCYNRNNGAPIKNPCPDDKFNAIKEAIGTLKK